MVFGFGGPSLKGCNAAISLHRTDFYAGEVVKGQLILTVEAQIECQAFTVVMAGEEILKWRETTSESGEYNRDADSNLPSSSTSTHHYDVKHDIARQTLSLLQPVGDAAPPAKPLITAGRHTYPFAFQLPSTLPNSHETTPTYIGRMEQLVSIVQYSISASIQLKGASKLKQVTTRAFTIHSKPVDPTKYPARIVRDSTAVRVMYFCCFNKGNCELTLSSERDTIDMNAGVFPLQVSVKNNTSLAIHQLEVVLQPVLTIHIRQGYHKTQTTAPAREKLFTKVLPQHIPPHSTKEGIAVPLLMSQVSAASRGAKVSFIPTCDLTFISFRYRVTVRVAFNGMFLTEVKAELPIKLLNMAKEAPAPVVPAPRSTTTISADEGPRRVSVVAKDETTSTTATTDATSVSISVAECAGNEIVGLSSDQS